MTPREKLATARLIVRRRTPYLTSAVYLLVPREQPGIGTLATTKHAVMMWDPAFVDSISVEELAFGIVHEAFHLLHKHFARMEGKDPKLADLAGDIAINPPIKDMDYQPLGGGRLIATPEVFGFPRGLTIEEYYELLKKLADENSKGSNSLGNGSCGSCAGNPHEGEGHDGQEQDRSGGASEGRSDADITRAVRQVAEEIQREAEKNRGTIPGELTRWAGEFLKPPRVRWQDKLARSCRANVAWKSGAVDYYYGRPSRRQSAVGIGLGCPVLPSMRAPVPRVTIAVDTSGSMGTSELGDAIREARGVMLALGIPVDFIACDARVHGGIRPVRDWRDLTKMLVGGGGTDFNPVFETIAESRRKPDVLIFITDGQGPAPESPPPGIKTIWLLVGPCAERPCKWGEHIVLMEHSA